MSHIYWELPEIPKPQHLKDFVEDVNRGIQNPINSQTHRLPNEGDATERKKRGRPLRKKPDAEPPSLMAKRKRGRPRKDSSG